MKPIITLTKQEQKLIARLINHPEEIDSFMRVKENIKIYSTLEKLDMYTVMILGVEINELMNELVESLILLDDNERNIGILNFIKEILKIKTDKAKFLINITLLHRINKALNKYLLE